MAPTRREFLKIAGISAAGLVLPPLASVLAGAQAGTPAAGGVSPTGSETRPGPDGKALGHGRWMPRKCRSGCTDCIAACHLAHNVPDFGNPKDEIHWIGTEKVAHVFPAETHPRLPESDKGSSHAGFLQPLRKSALRAGLPHARRPSSGRMGS